MSPSPTNRLSAADRRYLTAAVHLGHRHRGRTWPNPSVGCLIVDFTSTAQGRIVGRGVTGEGGRPHGERIALDQAGPLAMGATAYVSLEPCSHHGKTPPCADALVEAGIARCVVLDGDPDPRVSGEGFERLRTAGIDVVQADPKGFPEPAHSAFVGRVESSRPKVTLKLATSLDGKIALASGESQWITGEEARRHGQMQRAFHDAILVGSGTAMADDPRLTCRIDGLEARSPVRLVWDGGLKLTPKARLFEDAGQVPLWVLTGADAIHDARAVALESAGAKLLGFGRTPAGQLDPSAVLAGLAAEGLTSVLLEGGRGLAQAFLKADLIDVLMWYRSPRLIGEEGLGGIGALGVERLNDTPGFRRIGGRGFGDDRLDIYVR